MKKLAVGLLIGLGVVAILATLILKLTLNSSVKAQIEDTGREVAKASVKVGRVDISPFTGNVVIRNLLIGNPVGYGNSTAIRLGKIKISLSPFSIFSGKISIRSMEISSTLVNVEGSEHDNNITKLESNVHRGSIRGTDKQRFQVDDFLIRGGTIKVRTSVGDPVSVPFPVVRFNDIGKNGAGITMGELFSKVFFAVSENSQKIATEVFIGSVKGVGKDIEKGFNKAVKDIKEFFK